MNWQDDLNKLGCYVELQDNPAIINLKFHSPIIPKYLIYKNLLIDIISVDNSKFKVNIDNILFKIQKIGNGKQIVVTNVIIAGAFHPNAKPYSDFEILQSVNNNKIINEFCYERFTFDDTSPVLLIDNIKRLINSLKTWNYDAAYWRDFSILNLNIDKDMLYVNSNNGEITKGRKLARQIKKQDTIIKVSNLLNKYTIFDKFEIENFLLRIA